MSKKTRRFRWFAAGLGTMLAFAKYANAVLVRAGVRKRLTKSDEAKIKAQLHKDIDNLFKT